MTGASLCIANLISVVDKMNQAAKEATDETAEVIFTTSTEVFCPVKTGALKGSAKNEIKGNGLTEFRRRITYGGGIVDYAGEVHEIPYAHYNPSAASWKFLTIPFDQIAPTLMQRIGYRMQGII